jgi:tetratricopeptide (TPR) repeat protein
MKSQLGKHFGSVKMSSAVNGKCRLQTSSETGAGLYLLGGLALIAALMSVSIPAAFAQQASRQRLDGATIQGTVHDSAGKLIGDAVVRLEQAGVPGAAETKTNAAGAFAFSALATGSYVLTAEKSGAGSGAIAVVASSPGDQRQVDLVLGSSGAASRDLSGSSSPAAQVMEFADKPNFTVAGVTDWTAAGGHGSDTSLRTSEALTRETITLKADVQGHGPASYGSGRGADESKSKLRAVLATEPGGLAGEYDLALALNAASDFSQAREHVRKLLAHRENAELYRLAGELDEKLGDPLAAVHELEQAVRLDPNETNYFEWGSELLLHRAVWQAQEVFEEGAKAFPGSARMLTALGTALFAGARYDEAALRLCAASDLNPADPEPYTFMGKIEMVAPNPLPCVGSKLARFAEQQPGNSLSNYFYAMAIWKEQPQPPDQRAMEQVETLLLKAVSIDAKCADAYLQLGNLYASRHNYDKAIDSYSKATEANPELADTHYRLGVAYDRTGETVKAKLEFQRHAELKKQQAAEVERQRREVKQFLVVVPGKPAYPMATEDRSDK